MAKPARLVERDRKQRARDRRVPAYRAVTLGSERSDWGVVDRDGSVLFRGDARVAAMIASRLTRPE